MNIDEMIVKNMCIQNKKKKQLPNRDKMLLTLHNLQMMTVGQADRLFCNAFITESIQLLTNALLLYEEGYFDCAFYSIRQASELFNNMLYIANKGETELREWNSKARFPMNKKVKEKLLEIDVFYKQVKNVTEDFFDDYDEKIRKTNKIVHKQGVDNFYTLRNGLYNRGMYNEAEEQSLFIELFNSTLCMMIIQYIIIDPISLALTDEELSMRMNFSPMTEAADIGFIEENLSKEIIDKIKSTECFKELREYFMSQEEMLPSVYYVIRCGLIDLDCLDEINSQKHLLGDYERIIIEILLKGVKLSKIYPSGDFIGYETSIQSNYRTNSWSFSEMEEFLKQDENYNIVYNNVYRSIVKGDDGKWVLEHNEMLTGEEICIINQVFSNRIDKLEEILSKMGY